MGCTVVTIATTTGARAEQTGRVVAQQLGYRFISDEIIDRAAEKVGVPRDAVDAVEHSQPLLARLMQVLATSAAGDMPYTDAIRLDDLSPSYRALIQQVIRETAVEGNVVIVAHGAGILLANTPGVLRVLVTASTEKRISRLEAEPGVTRIQAEQRITRADHERVAYLERFFGLKAELPTHYDLIVNTDMLTAERAAAVIATAAGVTATVGTF